MVLPKPSWASPCDFWVDSDPQRAVWLFRNPDPTPAVTALCLDLAGAMVLAVLVWWLRVGQAGFPALGSLRLC